MFNYMFALVPKRIVWWTFFIFEILDLKYTRTYNGYVTLVTQTQHVVNTDICQLIHAKLNSWIA